MVTVRGPNRSMPEYANGRTKVLTLSSGSFPISGAMGLVLSIRHLLQLFWIVCRPRRIFIIQNFRRMALMVKAIFWWWFCSWKWRIMSMDKSCCFGSKIGLRALNGRNSASSIRPFNLRTPLSSTYGVRLRI